jgi:hypothetical protein
MVCADQVLRQITFCPFQALDDDGVGRIENDRIGRRDQGQPSQKRGKQGHEMPFLEEICAAQARHTKRALQGHEGTIAALNNPDETLHLPSRS